jgi:hypothetical protein
MKAQSLRVLVYRAGSVANGSGNARGCYDLRATEFLAVASRAALD